MCESTIRSDSGNIPALNLYVIRWDSLSTKKTTVARICLYDDLGTVPGILEIAKKLSNPGDIIEVFCCCSNLHFLGIILFCTSLGYIYKKQCKNSLASLFVKSFFDRIVSFGTFASYTGCSKMHI